MALSCCDILKELCQSAIVIPLFSFFVPCLSYFWSLHVLTDGDIVDRFNSTLQTVQAAGETNRIQQGLFENYVESKVKDPRLLLVSRLQSDVYFLSIFFF